MKSIRDIGTIEIERSQQARWKSGELAPEWARAFPQLFDEEDLRLTNEQGRLGYHFVDWLAAILLHHATGYRSVWNYERPKHARVEEVVGRLISADIVRVFQDRQEHGHAQPPDLLMYAPDFSDWFLCEVKGSGDRLSEEQRAKFEALAGMTGTPVRLLRFRWAPARSSGTTP